MASTHAARSSKSTTGSLRPTEGVAIGAKVAAGVIAGAVLVFAAYLLLVGVQWHIVSGDTTSTEYRPHQLAIVQLISAGLVLLGLWRLPVAVAWGGVILLGAVGALTVWSIGIPFLIAASVLMPLLAIGSRLPYVASAALSLPLLGLFIVLQRGRF